MLKKIIILCLVLLGTTFVDASAKARDDSKDYPRREELPNGDVLYDYGFKERGHWVYVKDVKYGDHKQSHQKCYPGYGDECYVYNYYVAVTWFDKVFSNPGNKADCLYEFSNFLKESAPYLLNPYYGYKQQVNAYYDGSAPKPMPLNSEPMIFIKVYPKDK